MLMISLARLARRVPGKSPLLASCRTFASTPSARVPLLVTPSQLSSLPKSTTIPLDVSWHMPNADRSAVAEYLAGPRIPHARRFDLDDVAELGLDKNPLGLSHMLPSASRFQEAVQSLGIHPDTHVVVYDTVGVFSSPRALYTFKAFGHENVSVLDGGLPRWIAEGYPVETGEVADFAESEYPLPKGPNPAWVKSYEQVVANAEAGPQAESFEIVLDHRSRQRWEGSAPEPRPSLSSGHIPYSLPAPFTDYLHPSSDKTPFTTFKSPQELLTVLENAVGGPQAWKQVVEGKRDLVFTCGSGMTAAIGWLAHEIVRQSQGTKAKTSIYDESWTGYASRAESTIVKGPK